MLQNYFIHGKTMYIAGSHTAKDWYDDVTKIPDWGDLRQSTRYQAAEKGIGRACEGGAARMRP